MTTLSGFSRAQTWNDLRLGSPSPGSNERLPRCSAREQIGADRSQGSARSFAGASHDERFIAVLIKLTCENACGKLPASRFWRMS